MKNQELKIGQRIELFKVLQECRYHRELLPVGSFRASYDVSRNICSILVDSTEWCDITPVRVCHTEFIPKTGHPVDVKPIGAMIIKSIK